MSGTPAPWPPHPKVPVSAMKPPPTGRPVTPQKERSGRPGTPTRREGSAGATQRPTFQTPKSIPRMPTSRPDTSPPSGKSPGPAPVAGLKLPSSRPKSPGPQQGPRTPPQPARAVPSHSEPPPPPPPPPPREPAPAPAPAPAPTNESAAMWRTASDSHSEVQRHETIASLGSSRNDVQPPPAVAPAPTAAPVAPAPAATNLQQNQSPSFLSVIMKWPVPKVYKINSIRDVGTLSGQKIKEAVETFSGIPVHQQILTKDGLPLENNAFGRDVGLVNGSVLYLDVVGEHDNGGLRVEQTNEQPPTHHFPQQYQQQQQQQQQQHNGSLLGGYSQQRTMSIPEQHSRSPPQPQPPHHGGVDDGYALTPYRGGGYARQGSPPGEAGGNANDAFTTVGLYRKTSQLFQDPAQITGAPRGWKDSFATIQHDVHRVPGVDDYLREFARLPVQDQVRHMMSLRVAVEEELGVLHEMNKVWMQCYAGEGALNMPGIPHAMAADALHRGSPGKHVAASPYGRGGYGVTPPSPSYVPAPMNSGGYGYGGTPGGGPAQRRDYDGWR